MGLKPEPGLRRWAWVNTQNYSVSDGYRQQADAVRRMAARAESAAQDSVYRQIAEGWDRLAAEALRDEPLAMAETRSFQRQG